MQITSVKQFIVVFLIIAAIGITVLIFSLIFGSNDGSQSTFSTTGGSVAETKKVASSVDFRMPVDELILAYLDNGVAASAKYGGKSVAVTGAVQELVANNDGQVYITIPASEAAGTLFGVQCFFKKNEAQSLSNLSRGDKITVNGKVQEYLLNVILVDCKLE